MTTVQGTGTPVTTAITSAVANRRMPSASDRVIRKMSAAVVLTEVPNRRCSSSYEVKRSPRKYAGSSTRLTSTRPMT